MSVVWSIAFVRNGRAITASGWARTESHARATVQRWRSHAAAIGGDEFTSSIATCDCLRNPAPVHDSTFPAQPSGCASTTN